MEIFPNVRVDRFEQLEPGDLFIALLDQTNCVGIKTDKPPNGDPNEIALLGPTFPENIPGPHLLPWQGVTCISFGKDYSVLLSAEAAAWQAQPPEQHAACLARVEDRLHVRVDGERLGRGYFPCYVDLVSGAVTERTLKGIVAYATKWEFLVAHKSLPARSILKCPF